MNGVMGSSMLTLKCSLEKNTFMPNSANVKIATHNQIKNFQSCYLHHETQENLHLGK